MSNTKAAKGSPKLGNTKRRDRRAAKRVSRRSVRKGAADKRVTALYAEAEKAGYALPNDITPDGLPTWEHPTWEPARTRNVTQKVLLPEAERPTEGNQYEDRPLTLTTGRAFTVPKAERRWRVRLTAACRERHHARGVAR